jgi:hypothetical protein
VEVETIVFRGENFAHINEPTVSFARRKIWFGMACLKHLSNATHVHFALQKEARRFLVIESTDATLNAVRWCTPSKNMRKISCDADVWDEIFTVENWSEEFRYKLLGCFVHTSLGYGFAFDLTRTQKFSLDGTSTDEKNPPAITLDEHCKNPLVKRFESDIAIPIDEGA